MSKLIRYLRFGFIVYVLSHIQAQGTFRSAFEGKCEKGWAQNYVASTCVRLFPYHAPWERARAICREHEGDLVQIRTTLALENILILLASTSPQVTLVALGLRWSENYKQFVWADSEEAMFTNWAEDEPNMRRGLCAEMIVAGNSPGQWLTVSCHRPINFVCEKSQACKAGTYGPGCKINCSENCAGADNACNYTDGACLLGCDDGFKGDTCNLAALQATADKEDPQGDDSFWNHYTTVLAVAMGLVASMFFTIVLTLRGDNIPVTPAQRRQSGAAASFSLEEGVTTGYRAQLAAIEEDAHDEDEAEDEDTNGGRNKTLNKKKKYNGSMAESSGPLADYSNGADA